MTEETGKQEDSRKVTVITYEEYCNLIAGQARLTELGNEITAALAQDRAAVHALYNLLKKCETCIHFSELKSE